MNDVAFALGPLVIHAYAAWLGGGVLAGLGLIALAAYRHDPAAVTRWLDVGIAAVGGGVIGARLVYVGLEWDYFADHTGEITRLVESGGLSWHGALWAGLPAALIAARLRRVPLRPWTDAAALAWPVGLSGAWLACRHAGCGYGCEVSTLADWPGWLVEELPDVFGFVAPRLDLQAGGAAFGGIIFLLTLGATWRGWLPGLRLWPVLALTGLGLALLGFFRADPAAVWHHRRADQWFDLLVFFLSALIGSTLWLLDRRAAAVAALPVDEVDENEVAHADYARTGPASS